MKKLLLNVVMCVLAMAGSTQGAWAESTTLYERTAATWLEDDITDWGNASATISNGLVQKGTNSAWNATKAITFTSNSKVTLTATVVGGNAGGNASSYDYITIGGVSLRLYGQSRYATIDIDGNSTNLSGFTRGGTYNLTVTIDQATGNVTYSVTGAAKGEGTGNTSIGLENVVVGHYRGGRENYNVTLTLSSITISEEMQVVEMANYTVNYQYNSETIKTESGTRVVGNTIEATSPITIEGQKYYATDDATTSITVTSNEKENVLNVTLRKAYEYNYTVQTNHDGTIAEGVGTEDESVTVPYPRYINVDGTLYTKDATNKEYRYTFTPTVNNQVVTLDYTATDITNVVYFSEGEHINGAKATSAGNNMVTRSSNSACGYATEDIVLTTLAPGKYTVKTVLYSNSSGGVSLKFGYGAQEFTASETTSNNWAQRSNDINVITSTDFVWKASGGAKDGLDYIYIQRTGDATASISLPYTYTTFSSTAALDFTGNTDVEAYMAQMNGDGTAVTLKQVQKVPAGAGVVLKKISGAETTTVKVLADAAALAGNQLVGVTEDNTVSADQLIEAGNAYVLVEEQFCKVVTGATGYIPAGKAYLSVPVRNAAKAMRLDFNGTPTEAVSVAEKAEKTQDAIYNVQGIRVQKPTVPGLYIVNGKTYRF